jgi:hypothetical protein
MTLTPAGMLRETLEAMRDNVAGRHERPPFSDHARIVLWDAIEDGLATLATLPQAQEQPHTAREGAGLVTVAWVTAMSPTGVRWAGSPIASLPRQGTELVLRSDAEAAIAAAKAEGRREAFEEAKQHAETALPSGGASYYFKAWCHAMAKA